MLCNQSTPEMWSLFKMRSVGPHSTSGREKEGKKERTGERLISDTLLLSRVLMVELALQSKSIFPRNGGKVTVISYETPGYFHIVTC